MFEVAILIFKEFNGPSDGRSTKVRKRLSLLQPMGAIMKLLILCRQGKGG